MKTPLCRSPWEDATFQDKVRHSVGVQSHPPAMLIPRASRRSALRNDGSPPSVPVLRRRDEAVCSCMRCEAMAELSVDRWQAEKESTSCGHL